MNSNDTNDNATLLLGTCVYRRVWCKTGLFACLRPFFVAGDTQVLLDALFDTVTAHSLYPNCEFEQWRKDNGLFYGAPQLDEDLQYRAAAILAGQKEAVCKSLRQCLESSGLAESLPKSGVRQAYWQRVDWCLFGQNHALDIPVTVEQETYWSTTTFDLTVVLERQGFPLAYAVTEKERKSKNVTRTMRSLVKDSGYTVSPLPHLENDLPLEADEECFWWDDINWMRAFSMPSYGTELAWTNEMLEAWLMLNYLSLWTDAALLRLVRACGIDLSMGALKDALTRAKLVCLDRVKPQEGLFAKIESQGDFERIAAALDIAPLPRTATWAQLTSILKLHD
ncbi:MAG: hypothetical protein Q4E62_06295 [Sutterellaceae bacterium]|nr:hypothetical protein [Sutterellaceae bacterium]